MRTGSVTIALRGADATCSHMIAGHGGDGLGDVSTAGAMPTKLRCSVCAGGLAVVVEHRALDGLQRHA